MQLRFVPKRGASPKWPGRGTGSYPFAGRTFDAETRVNKADVEPFAVAVPSLEANRFRELCVRDGDVFPADEATAAFCGVPFVRVERVDDSGWMPAAATEPPRRPARKESD